MPTNSNGQAPKEFKPGKFKGEYLFLLNQRCKGCRYCVEYCPKKVLKIGEEFNEKGYRYVDVEDEAECISCKFCQDICPDFAIYLAPKEGEESEGEDKS